jgi:hypothetical protein
MNVREMEFAYEILVGKSEGKYCMGNLDLDARKICVMIWTGVSHRLFWTR